MVVTVSPLDDGILYNDANLKVGRTFAAVLRVDKGCAIATEVMPGEI